MTKYFEVFDQNLKLTSKQLQDANIWLFKYKTKKFMEGYEKCNKTGH